MIEIRYQSPSRMCSNANTSMKLNNEKFATSEMQTSGIKILKKTGFKTVIIIITIIMKIILPIISEELNLYFKFPKIGYTSRSD